jgi:hypothetical protein
MLKRKGTKRDRVLIADTAAPTIKWNIYYACREYAREAGDPCLGQVMARTKADAEHIAGKLGDSVVRKWAVAAPHETLKTAPSTRTRTQTAF